MPQQIIYFNSRDCLIRIDVSKIVFFEGDGNYTHLVTVNKMKSCLTKNLAHIEESLATQMGEHAQRFMRIGKRFIINMGYIYQVDITKQSLILTDYDHFVYHLPASKEALRKVKELIVKTRI
jgi:DNA-binding LytR/AlgR family response regulator